jgi:serine/threonine-protein kinase
MASAFDVSPQDWAALRSLLDQALDLDPAERSRWLDDLDDARYAALKPRLRALLGNTRESLAAKLLDTLPKVETGQFAPRPPDAPAELPGGEVGPYRLIREIGSGGMASVWLAERTDMLQRRQVALKLPHGAWKRAGLAERMAREREILATLEHPHIARLYDAGVAADGQPYLALEFVEGERIDAYAERKSLDVPARLRLFLQVVRAVAHAHAHLVVHRDLKPSNLLVTEAGEVKLLDFGIAKLLEQGVAEETELTREAGRALTPEYAAPEQILGQPIGTAADVYALGVVLFELLAGQRPYALKRDSRAALEEAVLHAEAARPSSLAPAARRRLLRGDLDTIVLKALKKEPRGRYPTADAFAEDLQRWLDKRPVLAQPDSASYRLRRFVARNRVAVGIAGGTVAAVATGACVALWQMTEAIAQRDRANYQQARAYASNEFLDLLLEDVGSADKPRSLAEVLDRSTAQLEQQYGRNERVFAQMLYEASRRYGTINKSDRELALLDRVAGSARRLGDADLLANAQCAAARLEIDRDRSAADVRFAEAQNALARAATPTPEWMCARTRAAMQEADGDRAAAQATLKRALDRRSGTEPLPVSVETALLSELGVMQHREYDLAGSLASMTRMIDLLDRSGRGGSMGKVVALLNRASTLSLAGEVRAAAIEQEAAMALVTQVEAGGVAPVGIPSHLASSLLRLGDPARALELARADAERAAEAGNHRLAALAEIVVARALVKLHRFDEVEVVDARAEARLRANPQAYQRFLNEVELTRADQLLAMGRLSEAEAKVDQVLASLGYPAKLRAPGLSSALHTGARVALAQGNWPLAEQRAAHAAPIAMKAAIDPRRSANVGQPAYQRAVALRAMGRIAEAMPQAELAVVALREGFGAEHPETREAEALLGLLTARATN